MSINLVTGAKLHETLHEVTADMQMEVISASHHVTQPDEKDEEINLVHLAGFALEQNETLRESLGTKIDTVENVLPVIKKDELIIINASIQAARILMPEIVHRDLPRIVCGSTVTIQEPVIPFPRKLQPMPLLAFRQRSTLAST